MADREVTGERAVACSGEGVFTEMMKLLVEDGHRRDDEYAEEGEWRERKRESCSDRGDGMAS